MKTTFKYIAFALLTFTMLNGCSIIEPKPPSASTPPAVTRTDNDVLKQRYEVLKIRLEERVVGYRERVACLEASRRRPVPSPTDPEEVIGDDMLLAEYQHYILRLIDYIDAGKRSCITPVKNK